MLWRSCSVRQRCVERRGTEKEKKPGRAFGEGTADAAGERGDGKPGLGRSWLSTFRIQGFASPADPQIRAGRVLTPHLDHHRDFAPHYGLTRQGERQLDVPFAALSPRLNPRRVVATFKRGSVSGCSFLLCGRNPVGSRNLVIAVNAADRRERP